MTSELDVYIRRYERELAARIAAETLLEAKSRELYLSNEQLKKLTFEIETLAAQRTRELTLARNQAVDGSQAKVQFLTNVSHEVRTPMNGVLGVLHILAASELNDYQRQLVERAQASGGLLVSIINDILDVSKIEAGEFHIDEADVDLVETISSCCDYFAKEAQEKGLELVVDLNTDIPANIKSDPTRIQQVINNLLSNAVKFTYSGTITVRAERISAAQLEISVCDSGIGIASDKINSIFAPFTQADGTLTRQYGGTGLGLAICAHITKALGEPLQVSSEIGQGTRFSFRLNLVIAEKSTVQPQSFIDQFESGLVMVVDDNPVNCDIAREILLLQGLQVECFENGAQAVAAITQKKYDAVLMDIQMPVMDGLTATKTIRAMGGIYAQLPIIAVTAHARHEDFQNSFSAGMNVHLVKPIEPHLLLTTLARWIPVKKPAPTHIEAQAPGHASTQNADDDLPIIEGVDFKESLMRVNNNKNLLKKVILSFANTHKNDGLVLQELFAQQDNQRLQALAHKIKGSSATLGAKDLAKAAAALEADCKKGVTEHHQEHIQGISQQLQHLVAALSQLTPTEAKPQFVEKAVGDIMAELELFETMIQQDFVKAETALENLRTYIRQQPLLEKMKQHFDAFEMDAIKPLITELKTQLVSHGS